MPTLARSCLLSQLVTWYRCACLSWLTEEAATLAWLRKNVIVGIVGAVLAATVTGWLSGFFDSLIKGWLPSGADAACSIRESLGESWPFAQPPPAPDKFHVIIARLNFDDAEGSQTLHVSRVFRGQHGIEPMETCRVLRLPRVGEAAERGVIEKGRDWLNRQHAHLLIWGEVLKKDEAINLWFISRSAEPTLQTEPFNLKGNLLSEEFKQAAGAELLAVALAEIKPATEEGKYLADVLQPVAARLRHLISAPPQWLDNDQLSDLRFALGVALDTIGTQSGIDQPLLDATINYREVLKQRTRERVPLDWAATQNNLGNALQTLASARAAPPGSKRRSRPIARRSRNRAASACRSTGR